MEFIYEEDDISWLTQVPRLEEMAPNFNIGGDDDDFFSDNMDNVISLEEQPDRGTQVLYDNVVCEDISSDEDLDKM